MPNNFVNTSSSSPTVTSHVGVAGVGGSFDPQFVSAGSATYTNNNLTAACGGRGGAVGNTAILEGQQRYWEIHIDSWGGLYGPLIGILPKGAVDYNDVHAVTIWVAGAGAPQVYRDGAQGTVGYPYGVAITVGDTVGVLLDLDANTITFFKNGVSMGIAASDVVLSEYYAYVSSPGSSYPCTLTANFGASPFM